MTESKKEKTDAELIWAEIQDLPLDIYGIANRTIKQHVKVVSAAGSELIVTLLSSAVLPALEETFANPYYSRGKKYTVEQATNYIIIKRQATP